MKMTTREAVLAVTTLAVALAGVTAWMGKSRVQAWRDLGRTRVDLMRRLDLAHRTIERRPEVQSRLSGMLAQLPEHPRDKDVTAELLKTLESLAEQNGLKLTRRDPEKEKTAGELYEVSISCNWEGALDSLTHFLYAVQMQGAILDIRQLSVSPSRGGIGLTGSFTVACAYTREAGAEVEAPKTPGTAKQK